MSASASPSKSLAPGCLVGLLCALSSPVSMAIEWSAEPAVELTTEYNDNINYVTGPHKAVVGYALTPQLTLKSTAELWSLSGLAKISRYDYPSNNALSHTDHFLDFAYQRQNELNQWSLGVNLDRDSTLQSELAGTGLLIARAQRTSNSVAPSWTRNLTERDSLTAGYVYNEVTYGETRGAALTDYRVKDPSLTWGHVLSEKAQVNLTLDYSDFETTNPISLAQPRYHYKTKSAQVVYQRSFTDSLKASFAAGLRRTDNTIDGSQCAPGFPPPFCFVIPATTSIRTSGSLFSATLQKNYENSSLSGSLSRSLQPTGTQGLVQTDHLSIGYNSTLTERLKSTLSVSLYNTRSENSLSNSTANRYYSLTPALKWRMTEWWTIGGTYSYAVSQPTSGASARQNALYLTLDYTWPRISSSH
ncbi:MAG: hypothetical protein ACYDC8_00050 [Gammaproteobacteria bacterium]